MSPRIHLRPMEPDDLEELYQIENDPSLWFVSSGNVPYSKHFLREFVLHSVGDIFRDGQVRLMIEAEQQVVGTVDLVNFDPMNRRAEVGISLKEQFRGKGYATEALQQLSVYARQRLQLHQLYAFVTADNEPSLRLFRKVGFTECGHLKDWYSLDRTFHDALLLQFFL